MRTALDKKSDSTNLVKARARVTELEKQISQLRASEHSLTDLLKKHRPLIDGMAAFEEFREKSVEDWKQAAKDIASVLDQKGKE